MSRPLLQFLQTPVVSPEPPRLRRLRQTWVLLCALLAIAASLNTASVTLFGRLGALPALLLVLAVPVVGWIYFRARTRVDAARNRGGEP